MFEGLDILLVVGVPVVLLLLGLVVGRTVEQQHLRNLEAREQALRHMIVTDVRSFYGADPAQAGAQLVVGQAVIATDYLKNFLARLRKLIGGELRSYESLLLRARREAILRMLEEAQRLGCDGVCNVRLDTADISGSSTNRNKVPAVAVLASGTAYRCAARHA